MNDGACPARMIIWMAAVQHNRVIFHIDVNSAFVSWSAVKILAAGGQDIRLAPSAVSGDPSDRRSIVSAKSIPAGKFGISTGEPISMALRKCPGLVIVRGDWEWYRTCSNDFIAICRAFSPTLEQFSIDECFLDMTGHLDGKDPVQTAYALRDRIRNSLGFTVNVGVSSNKLLAKMASDFEKPDKVHTLWPEEIADKMWPLPVRSLLWVGRKTEARLSASGIDTIGKLATVGMMSLTAITGRRAAEQLHACANGIDDSPVNTEEEDAKSYSSERTFRRDITQVQALDRELFKATVEVAHRIRKDDVRAYGVSAFIKTRDFEIHSRQSVMKQPSDVTGVILDEARRIISNLWDGVTPLRQVGVGVYHLTHDRAEQLSLFQDDERMAYLREWDRDYDRKMEQEEDARHQSRRDRAITFAYADREEALAAAKNTVKGRNGLTFGRITGREGIDGFEIADESGKVIELHVVKKAARP